jgi:hypothetical protein
VPGIPLSPACVSQLIQQLLDGGTRASMRGLDHPTSIRLAAFSKVYTVKPLHRSGGDGQASLMLKLDGDGIQTVADDLTLKQQHPTLSPTSRRSWPCAAHPDFKLTAAPGFLRAFKSHSLLSPSSFLLLYESIESSEIWWDVFNPPVLRLLFLMPSMDISAAALKQNIDLRL